MEWTDEDNEAPRALAEQGVERLQCPYCWEFVEIPIEDDLLGALVWDCEVCCRPWLVHISEDSGGQRSVTVERAQG